MNWQAGDRAIDGGARDGRRHAREHLSLSHLRWKRDGRVQCRQVCGTEGFYLRLRVWGFGFMTVSVACSVAFQGDYSRSDLA